VFAGVLRAVCVDQKTAGKEAGGEGQGGRGEEDFHISLWMKFHESWNFTFYEMPS